ncbi:MAG: TIGR02147 family protein [Planctomycetota bacterium]
MKTHTTSPRPDPERGFRACLQQELARRCAGNDQYSLRAFAADLGIDHSSLSQLLRGKRALTESMIGRLGGRLGLAEEDITGFVRAEATRSAVTVDPVSEREMFRLAEDARHVLTEWQHFAILELTRLDSFRPDVRWIARVLDISRDDVVRAVDRLARLRLLEMRTATEWVDRSGDRCVGIESMSRATLQALAEQQARLATRSSGRSADERLISASTVTIRRADLPEILARLERWRAEVVQEIQAPSGADDVYRLDLTFLPLTRLGAEPFEEERE